MPGYTRIYLDMDGVLCDFVSSACAALKVPVPDFAGQYDLCTALGIEARDFWRQIDRLGFNFWAELLPYPWTRDLTLAVSRVAPVAIATSPSRDPMSLAGKYQWIRNNLGQTFREFMVGPRKEWLAAPGTLLIDDNPDQCAAFSAAGGGSILFPRPWNDLCDKADYPLDHVLPLLRLSNGGS